MFRILLAAVFLALPAIAIAADPPPVYVVYFVPDGMEPHEGYVDRLDRVMTEVQNFYREGMKSHGYGEKTFALQRDEQGKLIVHRVDGEEGKDAYGRNSHGKIYREIVQTFAAAGKPTRDRVYMMITPLLIWDGDRAIEHGPYVGGGSHLGGAASSYDDPLLGPENLSSKEPGAYYHRPVSVGQFNSHYIGGIAHELGHAFSLPHVCQKRTDRATALMGSGNHTYGNNLRGQGTGTFLTANSAMFLRDIRAFAGDIENARTSPEFKLNELSADFVNGVLTLTGQVETKTRTFGLAAFNDGDRRSGNYDSVGWTCGVDEDGRFELKIGEFYPGGYELRLVFCHEGGIRTTLKYRYEVDKNCVPTIDMFEK